MHSLLICKWLYPTLTRMPGTSHELDNKHRADVYAVFVKDSPIL